MPNRSAQAVLLGPSQNTLDADDFGQVVDHLVAVSAKQGKVRPAVVGMPSVEVKVVDNGYAFAVMAVAYLALAALISPEGYRVLSVLASQVPLALPVVGVGAGVLLVVGLTRSAKILPVASAHRAGGGKHRVVAVSTYPRSLPKFSLRLGVLSKFAKTGLAVRTTRDEVARTASALAPVSTENLVHGVFVNPKFPRNRTAVFQPSMSSNNQVFIYSGATGHNPAPYMKVG